MQREPVDLGVPGREVAGWSVLFVLLAGAVAADLRWGSGAVAVGGVVVLVLLGGSVVPSVVGRVVLHPEGHLTVRSPLGTARYEMEQIDTVVVASAGPVAEGAEHDRFEGSAPALPLFRIAELVLLHGVDVALPSTLALPLPPLRRRLDRQVAAVRAWLEEGPA